MNTGLHRPAAFAVIALLFVLALSTIGYTAARPAVSCATGAAAVATDLGRLHAAGQDPAAAGRALTALERDLGRIGTTADTRQAVTALRAQAELAARAAATGRVADPGPLDDAAGNLTRACAS